MGLLLTGVFFSSLNIDTTPKLTNKSYFSKLGMPRFGQLKSRFIKSFENLLRKTIRKALEILLESQI